MTDDAELLRQYVQTGSEDAFAELVHRHLSVVYSSALRQTDGDAELAKDICQTVFIDLGRKARSLLGHELVIGWLFAATRFTAADMLRGNRRRQNRESIAASMHENAAEPAVEDPRLTSALDAAMAELPSEDRNAVLLRFFQGKPLKDVGAALGINEDAARMRVSRALDRLHGLLKQRGVTLSVAALGTALAAQAVTAVPAGLAASIAATALATAAAGGFGVGVVKYLALTKAKLLAFAGVTALAAGLLVMVRLTSNGPASAASGSPGKASTFVPFSVQGTLTYEVPGKPLLYTHFTASVSNSSWHISAKQESNTAFLSDEYHYDGTNTLQYSLISKSGPNVGSGSIHTGPVPSWESSVCGEFVWLAYASGYYFHGLKAGTATSLEPLRGHGHTRRQEVPAEWELASDEPFLPIEVSYYATNVAVLDNAGNVVSVPLDKSRAPRYVAAHLRTWDTVAFQGMTIPRHFECITYAPWPHPETKGIGCIVRGNATNVCSLIPFPTLPATLHLQDNRVPEAAVVYKVTDGKVPALETDFMTNARAKGLKLIENPLHVKNPEPDCNKTTTILGTWFWDVESNHLGGDSEIGGSKTDFWWQRDADGGAYLVPVNGAKAAIVEGQEFETIDSEYVRHVALSDEKIASGALKPGAILVFRTAEGRVGKLQVVGYKALHEFDFPEASYLTEGWKRYALSQPNERAYHLQVRCTVFK